ncbi:MAG: ABC transporter ATP-binding protein [Ruthenibacterium sp.]
MKKGTVKRILSYLSPYRMQLVLAYAAALLYVLFSLLVPVVIGSAVDAIVGKGQVDFAHILSCIGLIAAFTVLAGAAQWALNLCTRKLSSFAARDIRSAAFQTFNRTPLNYMDAHAHGDLISRMVNDADLVADGLLQGLTQLLPGVATILGTLIVMLLLNHIIALVVVCVTPVSILFAGIIAKRTAGYFKQQSAAQGALSAYINEMVPGQSLVQAFGAEERCFAKFDRLTDTLYESGVKSTFYSAITNPGTRFVNALVYAAVGVIGAIVTVSGGMTVGQLSCFLTYANQYTKPFNEVTGVLTQLQNAQASAERLFAVIDEPIEQADVSNAAAPKTCEGRVQIENVAFSYVPKTPLITNFNLSVKPGQRVAIVGPTGCGKTTLINLLMRFYDVNSGVISVDGVPIKAMRRAALRGLYGMVLQETWLKNATVRENIAYGKPDADMDEIKAAAKAVYAHSFIKRLPQGYDTVITPEGGNLSAGQKQLLCIARIMLCAPDMLILDEATSSIDTRTEMLVQSAFETLMRGHTSFVVAHRLSTIRTADVILVMKAGQIVEQGTHDELLLKNEFYAKLYSSQFAPM